MRRGARERGETHAHACTPSLPPSLPPSVHARAPRAREEPRPRRTAAAGGGGVDPPAVPPRVSFPLPVARPPSFPFSISLPSVLFVFHLFARCVVTLGELAGGGPVGTSEHRVCAHAFLLFPPACRFCGIGIGMLSPGSDFHFPGMKPGTWNNTSWLYSYTYISILHIIEELCIKICSDRIGCHH